MNQNKTDIKKLLDLEQSARALEVNPEQRRNMNQEMEGVADQFLDQLSSEKTYHSTQPEKAVFHITNEQSSVKKVLNVVSDHVFPHGINAASGGHLGYIPGGGLYASAIADYLAAVSNAYAGVYFASPGAVEIEEACLNWLKTCFEFPETSIGNLTSGGSIANLIALTAARDAKSVLCQPVSDAVIYMTEQVHHCIHKALRIIGLENVTIRSVRMDERGRMDIDQLSSLLEIDEERGQRPFMVIASAGTTDTGAIDPLKKLSTIAKKHDMWFHVDAAYGGFFKLLPEYQRAFAGIEEADSLVIDPHKGLFLPYGIGAVLVKNRDAVFKSHHYTANYMQDATAGDVPVSPADVSPELTKHFRALRMWLPLKLHGLAPFRAALEEKIMLTHYFRERLEAIGFKLGPPPELSVSYFWYPQTEAQDAFNQKLLKRCHQDGRVFLSSTRVEGKYVIRMAILSFRTHKATIDQAVSMLEEQLNKIMD